MRLRFFQFVGWVSFIFAFGIAGACDQGALSAAAVLGGSVLCACGLLLGVYGQCKAVLTEKQHENPALVRVQSTGTRCVR